MALNYWPSFWAGDRPSASSDELATLRAQLSAAIGERDRALELANATSAFFRVWVVGDEPRPTKYPEWDIMSWAAAKFDVDNQNDALSTSRKDGTS